MITSHSQQTLALFSSVLWLKWVGGGGVTLAQVLFVVCISCLDIRAWKIPEWSNVSLNILCNNKVKSPSPLKRADCFDLHLPGLDGTIPRAGNPTMTFEDDPTQGDPTQSQSVGKVSPKFREHLQIPYFVPPTPSLISFDTLTSTVLPLLASCCELKLWASIMLWASCELWANIMLWKMQMSTKTESRPVSIFFTKETLRKRPFNIAAQF